MKAHFVTFNSPGSFCAEEDTSPIESWDVDKAVARARGIKQRHGATPYGFYFTTRERSETELDSKLTQRSNFYFLGGKVLTLEEVEARGDPKDETLIWNMRTNHYTRIIENGNSYKWTQPLADTDVVLEFQV